MLELALIAKTTEALITLADVRKAEGINCYLLKESARMLW